MGAAKGAGPEVLGGLDGTAGLKEVAGGGELGHIQSRGGGELRQGEKVALVAGHVHSQGALFGKAAQGIAEGRLVHGGTSCEKNGI